MPRPQTEEAESRRVRALARGDRDCASGGEDVAYAETDRDRLTSPPDPSNRPFTLTFDIWRG